MRSVEAPWVALTESLEVLAEQGYIAVPLASSVRFNGMLAALASSEGLLAYAEWAMPNFETVLRKIATEEREATTDSGIAEAVGQPIRFVEAVLDRFEMLGWVSLTKVTGGPGNVHVDRVSPQLRRALQ